MMRRKCLETDHKFATAAPPGALPYVFCRRWFCSASAVAMWVDDALAVALHNAIPEADRWPPVELAEDGTVARVLGESETGGGAVPPS